MLSKFAVISIDELKWAVPRIVVYTGLAYAATRVVRFAITQTGRLMGSSETK